MRILKQNSAAVIIDIQEKLFPHMFEKDSLERKVGMLINGLQILNIECILTEQYTKGLGLTIPSVSGALTGCGSIEKTAFSCCDDQDFMHLLKQKNPVHVILAGIEAHVCVLQTSLDLIQMGFKPVVPVDCVSSRNETDKRIAIDRMRNEGVVITSCESLLFELLRYSGTESFKAISKLVK